MIAHVTDDWLNDKPGERCSQPQNRDLVGTRSKVFVDGAHVRHLQSPAELDPEEPEAHVPDLPESQPGFVHHASVDTTIIQQRKLKSLPGWHRLQPVQKNVAPQKTFVRNQDAARAAISSSARGSPNQRSFRRYLYRRWSPPGLDSRD